ncbi:antibiotic biosynthesis monooxygenase [Streptomyces palmae]|uniref:Antibiotic biosynthesis monooxygenase n=1 Tax=Streptomyces palmae TaxID=1701085 RepID=A0A4Z0HFX1_9ACTN|nr:antibiotic biosynthesis monooxygenase [Streptomyces palmae]TGB14687.1 antibiotic biosynthesis monooxygenase [Streptomyces palmae]
MPSTPGHPDPAEPGVGAPLFSTWSVGTPERQQAAAQAIEATWRGRPWPDANLVSYGVYAADDGDTLMHYSQWREAADYFAFFASHRQERNDSIDQAVPGIKRLGLSQYRLYRSHVPDPDRRAVRAPGLIVTVDGRFDPAAAHRRTEWVDTVVDTLTADRENHRELLGAHFHLLVDGARHLSSAADRVFNYAEWTSEEAYDQAMAAHSGPADWQRVADFPGFRGSEITRYRLLLHLHPQG